MKIKTWVERVPTDNMELSMPPRQHYRDEWHAALDEKDFRAHASGSTECEAINEVKAMWRARKKCRIIEWDGED